MTVNFASRANWGTINPAEMGWTGRYDPRHHPDMLKQIEFRSRSGAVVRITTHKLWAPILLEALRILDPHIQGGFDKGPDKGSFNPGSTLQDGSPSMHAVAQAADLEWQQNPMYAWPRPTGPHTLPRDTEDLLRHLGIYWGGLWDDLHDWMHIENHLSPADTIALAKALANRKPPTISSPFPYRFKPGNVIGPLADPSTKVHGGVTYGEQVWVDIIIDALQEIGYKLPDGRIYTGKVQMVVRDFQLHRMHATRRQANGNVGPATYKAIQAVVHEHRKAAK